MTRIHLHLHLRKTVKILLTEKTYSEAYIEDTLGETSVMIQSVADIWWRQIQRNIVLLAE